MTAETPAAPRNAGDVPTLPVLAFLAEVETAGSSAHVPFTDDPAEDPERSIRQAMLAGTPRTVARAKLRRLYRRGLVKGCLCGCRGDFRLTDLGWDALVFDPDA